MTSLKRNSVFLAAGVLLAGVVTLPLHLLAGGALMYQFMSLEHSALFVVLVALVFFGLHLGAWLYEHNA